MVQIIKVDFHLVGPDDGVIVSLWVGLLGEQFLFVAILDAGRARDAGAQLEHAAVVALQLVSIARHVGTRPDKAHLADKHIDQLGEAVHLAMAQPMAHACNTRVVGRGDSVAFGLLKHRAELAYSERFPPFSDTPLHEKHGTFRVYLDEDADDEQR